MTESTSTPIISLNGVGFSYGGPPILEDVSLTVHRGDFVGIIGPNGSGKTTLLKILLGLLRPTAGQVALFGAAPLTFTHWQKIGYVPQRAGLDAQHVPITVYEVAAMAGGSSTDVQQALASVGMQDSQHRLLSELSGGQQQRVFIARSLVGHPELLILDEPTVGVDADSQAKFYQLLKKLNGSYKLTMILVSHDLDVIAHEVKTVACINKTVVFHGPPQKMTSQLMARLFGGSAGVIHHAH